MMKVEMQLTKSTKNTHVYSNDTEDGAIPTLYIKKLVRIQQGVPNELRDQYNGYYRRFPTFRYQFDSDIPLHFNMRDTR